MVVATALNSVFFFTIGFNLNLHLVSRHFTHDVFIMHSLDIRIIKTGKNHQCVTLSDKQEVDDLYSETKKRGLKLPYCVQGEAVCALGLRCIVDVEFSRWRRRSRNFPGYVLYFSVDIVLF